MNARCANERLSSCGGLTLIDVLIAVAAVVIVVAFVLPTLTKPRRSSRIGCVNNLKQVGLGFLMWANDNDDKFPWQVSQTNGGTKEYASSGDVYRHFLVATNEMNSPKILACWEDSQRTRTNSFAGFNNQNLSYFVGLDAAETKPTSILSGDRAISTNGVITKGLISLSDAKTVSWAKGIHPKFSNIGFADGSVQELRTAELRKVLTEKATLPTRLSLP